jgi:hypothetical protein
LLGGIARNTLYDLLRSGALASVPIGRRRFIPARDRGVRCRDQHDGRARGWVGRGGSGGFAARHMLARVSRRDGRILIP